MRILFTALPAYGLSLPLVPLAWAARAAGHDILFASATPMSEVLANAGLPIVDGYPGRDLWLEFTELANGPRDKSDDTKDIKPLLDSKNSYGYIALQTIEATVRTGAKFGADVVVYTCDYSSGPFIAAALGVPGIEIGNRMAWSTREPRYRTEPNPLNDPALLALLRRRVDLTGPVPGPIARVDQRAPSIGGLAEDVIDEFDGRPWWPMRSVSYNGGVVVPDWALAEPSRPRVLVTLGTTVPFLSGVSSLGAVLEAIATMDIEVVLATGNADLTELGELPDNVIIPGFLPFSAVLPRCSLVIHHGGAGTIAAAQEYAVPHLVLPAYEENVTSADQLCARGTALQEDPRTTTAERVRDAIRRLLDEPAFAKAAREVADEVAAQPSPAEIIARLTNLIGRSR
ncbi:DUF1205 domain-containing protein [Nocardia terpenica]|uniref:nucleotide disphospho-sugar-binding domain-containing protein n=1 Tax=Nocardia terpenica TaxID=455432 RepID=UPI001893CFC7|nr:nucleotide disphospho-sugar-binding domain-containing protein [Nocardia terpenica]MBF6063315.1 DUF1205 domain-containing protein [Nocardia terpenica]MBF6105871.1 DUF1205 domain-containing protein [Nocardia terpenica]MBF6113545.1 DUF1205 domain-containing protein [Nocardia terpenica]MBF6119612.1 DUF1205 domain-containing protein [Nocardia terpenica]MBF6152023.1 DUF1205 domain-containing protein [Nocardia terpenica]